MTPLFEDHLSLDAVVAFADGELSMVAFQRAAAHLERCPSCAAEVAEQTSARECLRTACTPHIPGALFDQLRSIPLGLAVADQPGEPHGHRGRITRSRGFRMGAGFLLAGIAISGLAATGADRPGLPNPVARPGVAPADAVVPSPLAAQPVARRLGG